MTEDIKKTDKKFGMVSIPLNEYEELRAQGRMITDPDLINVIDKICLLYTSPSPRDS